MEELLLKRALNTPHGKVSGSVLFPEPFDRCPAPTNLLINSRLEDQLFKGCLGSGV
mgnify:CR=1